MNGAFVQLRQRLQNHTFNGDSIAVLPMTYQLPLLQRSISSILTIIQYAIIGIAIWGPINAFKYFQTVFGPENTTGAVSTADNSAAATATDEDADVPQLVKTLEDQRYIVMTLAFMAIPMLKGMIGPPAFEVFGGDKLLFSALDEGRVPNFNDILTAYRGLGNVVPLYGAME